MKLRILFTVLVLLINCNPFQSNNNDDDKNRNLLLAALIASRSSTSSLGCVGQYAGLSCIPDSLTTTSTVTGKNFKVVTGGDSTYTNLPQIYQPVRDTVKLNRDIVKAIGTLITGLRTVNVSSTTLTGTTTWGDDKQAAKYRYRQSTRYSGGKWLEVWWTSTATAPYTNLKAIEIEFLDNGDSSKIEGIAWGRYKISSSQLGVFHLDFLSDPSTSTKTNAVILQEYSTTPTDPNVSGSNNAYYFYAQEKSSIAKLDGTFTIRGLKDGLTNQTAGRAYTYTAAANSTKAALKVAVPLSTNSSTTVFNNYDVANIAEVWNDWLLFTLGTSSVTSLNSLGCTLTSPASANPVTKTSSNIDALKSCFDKLGGATSTNSGVKSSYYVTAAQNPAFYTLTGTTSILESTVTAKDSSWDSLTKELLSAPRNGNPGDGYTANFTASNLYQLNILTGVGLGTRQTWSGENVSSAAPF
ncbi:MAG: hypothetical protein SFU98_03200 [Leptospiraceae bacterium]|nr:hypothetical protein [Leptospiraceae bacterium]